MHVLTAAVLAAPVDPSAPGFLNGTAIWGMLIFAASLIIAFVGLYAILIHGKKGNVKGAAGSLGVVAIGSLIIAIGAAGTFVGVASGAFAAFTNV